jgi:murein DD-endopeptidase MepM/ murein hydrolase activator NlpD
MNAKHIWFAAALSIAPLRSIAANLIYQPSPYKGTDVWVTNYYSYNDDYGVNDGKLVVGGWGDWYRSALKFDMEGLPANPTKATLGLYCYPAGGSTVPVDMTAYALSDAWNESSGWYSVPWSGYNYGIITAPSVNRWNGIGITNLYKQWKSGSLQNKGLMFVPNANTNKFNYFVSSDYSVPQYRPYLNIEYSETVTPPALRMPLPGGRKWVVTTEIGSGDAKNPELILDSHTGINYFSIDFGPQSLPAYSGDIPVYASAAGVVVVATYNSFNGNHVVINHSGQASEYGGFTTRYLHFKYPLKVSPGQFVSQGDVLGYMGNTGAVLDNAVHLHFGVRYNGSGASSVNELSFVKLEGLPLKQYQTEIDGYRNRHENSYFLSSNTQ